MNVAGRQRDGFRDGFCPADWDPAITLTVDWNGAAQTFALSNGLLVGRFSTVAAWTLRDVTLERTLNADRGGEILMNRAIREALLVMEGEQDKRNRETQVALWRDAVSNQVTELGFEEWTSNGCKG